MGRIIVLGFPRSGTGTMAAIHNLGHETMNYLGTADWRMANKYGYKTND